MPIKKLKQISSSESSSNNSSDSDNSDCGEQKHDFQDCVIKYVRLDDILRKKQVELRRISKPLKEDIDVLKSERTELEKILFKILEIENKNLVNIGDSGKLIKTTSVRKGGIKVDMIKESIVEGIKIRKLNCTEQESIQVLDTILSILEGKRPVKERTYLKRTFARKQKTEKPKKK
jgi:hypothetical protein